MKKELVILIVICLQLNSCSNNNSSSDYYTNLFHEDSLISLLPGMQADSFNCEADVYWKIVKRGKVSIPFLIESLADRRMTNIYNHCKQGKLNVGEVCYFALQEIAEFPAFIVTHIQFDVFYENGCWSFYDYLFDDNNKMEYQKMVKKFYYENTYTFIKYDSLEINECRRQYKIEGSYKLSDK